MTEFVNVDCSDPTEGSDFVDVNENREVKVEQEDEDDTYNTMDLLELATCIETPHVPLTFPSTDAVLYPKTGLMVCLLCLEDVETNLLSDHMVNAHNYRKVLMKCQICGMDFAERSMLTLHKKTCRPHDKRHKRKSVQQIMKELDTTDYSNDTTLTPCPLCLAETPKYCLKDHLITEHMDPELTLTCGICKRTFKNKATLRDHVKLVHASVEQSEECEICGMKFRSQKYLSNHKRNVHPRDNKVHTCSDCGKTFKSRLCLHQHCKYVHPPPSAVVSCPHCPGKLFKSKINLQQHLKVSHGIYKKAPFTD